MSKPMPTRITIVRHMRTQQFIVDHSVEKRGSKSTGVEQKLFAI